MISKEKQLLEKIFKNFNKKIKIEDKNIWNIDNSDLVIKKEDFEHKQKLNIFFYIKKEEIKKIKDLYSLQLNESIKEELKLAIKNNLLNTKSSTEIIETEIEIEFQDFDEIIEFIQIKNLFLEKNRFSDFYICEQNTVVSKTIKKFVNNNMKNNVCCLWGNKGIGKTHLIGSVLDKLITEDRTKLSFLYIDTDYFIEKFYKFKKLNKSFEKLFLWIYSYDLIIFDSFELIKKKREINKIFIHFLEKVPEDKKVLFIYSFKNQIFEDITEKITSKFSIIIKLNSPNRNDIKRIVQNFIQKNNKNIKLTSEAIDYLVENLGNNIQKIQNKLINIFIFMGDPNFLNIIDVNGLKKIFKRMNIKRETETLVNYSENPQIKNICEKLNFDIQQIFGKNRKKDTVLKRNIVIYILKTKLGLTHEEIGVIFNKKHSTISHCLKQMSKKLEDKYFKEYLKQFTFT